MDKFLIEMAFTVVCAVIASSGFWSHIQKKSTYLSSERRMIMGLGHIRIMDLGMRYVNRGYITHEEYQDFRKYLYEPYRDMGGNGSAERMMREIDKLPIKAHTEADTYGR